MLATPFLSDGLEPSAVADVFLMKAKQEKGCFTVFQRFWAVSWAIFGLFSVTGPFFAQETLKNADKRPEKAADR